MYEDPGNSAGQEKYEMTQSPAYETQTTGEPVPQPTEAESSHDDVPQPTEAESSHYELS